MLMRRLLGLLLMFPVAAVAQAPTEKGYVDTAPGVSIYFERYGTGPNVVFVPGRFLMPEFSALARPDRSLILYDMRNRGLSKRVEDTAQINILGDVADVEALRQHFRVEKFSLVGFSYLGLMVPLYATQHPERIERLVQIGPVPRKFGTPYPADQVAGIISKLESDDALGLVLDLDEQFRQEIIRKLSSKIRLADAASGSCQSCTDLISGAVIRGE